MTINEASSKLTKAICPSGISIRPDWFTTVGIDETNAVLYVYAVKVKPARKALEKILDKDKNYEGFKVIVKKLGPFQLCGR